mmetsp:Transcript_35800/g.76466  ORF Transcript_35800/g.76466 Transcript_35800/m.76466 type:complete len:271 (+) Transcript_35800:700-1512(+)
MTGRAVGTTSNESSFPPPPPPCVAFPMPALMSARASDCFFFSFSLIAFFDFLPPPAPSKLMSSSSSTGATLNPPSIPASLSLLAFLRSILSMDFRRFSWRFCLSVLGMDAMMSSASTWASSLSSSSFFERRGCFLRFLAGLSSSSSESIFWTPSASTASSSSASSLVAARSAAKEADMAAPSMLSKRGLLNHREVLTEAGSSASLKMRGLEDGSSSSTAFFEGLALDNLLFLGLSSASSTESSSSSPSSSPTTFFLSLPSLTTFPSSSLS